MNTNLEKRIAALEERTSIAPIVVILRDGTQRSICASGKHFLKLASHLGSDAVESHPLSAELSWLRDALTIEGDASEAFNLLSVLCQGANEQPEDEGVLRFLKEHAGGGK